MVPFLAVFQLIGPFGPRSMVGAVCSRMRTGRPRSAKDEGLEKAPPLSGQVRGPGPVHLVLGRRLWREPRTKHRVETDSKDRYTDRDKGICMAVKGRK